ncbi:hypothetical protein LP420_22465 [Massilia sp. B-10]|nr:hypothetical protein LP420_22465 [Massilia sp. B-10]
MRHALAFCFQPQDEIIRRHQLFHGADDNFFAQALKDTLPYLLGAVDDEYVRKSAELRRLREQLRAVERQLAELNSIRGDGVGKAAALLAQARDAGLSDVVTEDWHETISALRAAATVVIAQPGIIPDGGEYRRLSDARIALLANQRRFREEMDAVRAFERDTSGYSTEATEQQSRLASIGMFDDSAPGHSCPLCTQVLPQDDRQPQVSATTRRT